MEQIILNGVNASGTLEALPGLGIHIKSVEIDLPLDQVGTTDPSVTVSGSVQGAYTFHGDSTMELRFDKGEEVNITTDTFAADYTAIIRYVRYGDQRSYRAINSKYHTIPTPWRFRS